MTLFLVNQRDLPRMNLGVIADDVTGGTDLASVPEPVGRGRRADLFQVLHDARFDRTQQHRSPARVFLYEIYTDDAAFGAHLKMPHFLAFDADSRASIEHKVVEKWERP